MRRIEFLGANGVGKTTVVRFILRKNNRTLLNQFEGRVNAAKFVISTLPFRKKLARRFEFLLTSRRKRRAKQLRNQNVMELLERESGEVQDFIKHALAIIAESDLSVNDKWAQTTGFFEALYDALFIGSVDLPNIALCDESISLRVLMVAMLAPSRDSAVRLFELMPLPDALVFMHGDEEAILKRLLSREQGKAYTHIHYLRDSNDNIMLEKLKQLNSLAAEGSRILSSRGCLVINLDVDLQGLPSQALALEPMLRQLAS